MEDHDQFVMLGDVPALPFMPRRKGGKLMDSRSVRRWASHGVSGVVLRTAMVGGMKCTRPSWVMAFIEATTEAVQEKEHV